MKPRKGSIAFCNWGILGLITEDGPREVTYKDGNKSLTWVGIRLEDGIGEKWSSRSPRVVGHIEDLIRKL